MKKTYYKVIMKYEGEICSAVVYDTIASVVYKKGEWVKAEDTSPLFVFETKKAAKHFCCSGWVQDEKYGKEIWRCEIKGGRKIKEMLDWMEYHAFIRFWRGDKENLYVLAPPTRTYGCEQVKLISKVKV